MGEVLRLRQKMLLLIGACLLALSLASAGCTAVKGRQSKQQEPLPTTNIAPLGSRILVVSPHPDDEGLATAGLLQQAVKGHVDVRVVVVTAGDASAGAVRSFSRAGPASPEEFRMMGNARPDFTRKSMPYVVERDPSNDSFPSTAGKGGELNRVSFCMGDSRAYLALSTGGRVRADLDYAFHLRVFKGHRVDRYDIEVRDKEARYGAFASNSVTLRGRIPVHFKVNRLWIILPASAFTGRDALMLSVDSTNGTSTLDRTVWHRLYL